MMRRLLLTDPGSLDANPPKDYRGWTSLDSLAEAVRTDTGSPAIGIAVMRDDKLEQVVAGARELGKPAVVTANDPWSIGSIGKPICSTIIGSLVERGKLSWNTTLKQALPGI